MLETLRHKRSGSLSPRIGLFSGLRIEVSSAGNTCVAVGMGFRQEVVVRLEKHEARYAPVPEFADFPGTSLQISIEILIF